MEFNRFLSLIILFSSWVFVGFSQLLGNELLGGGSTVSMSCVQKLSPCQAYLKSESKPPESCCTPLKEMITGNTECVCGIFNNPALLQNFNVTQADALKLPEACGAKADLTKCTKDATTPTTSPSTSADNQTSPTTSPDTSTNNQTTPLTPATHSNSSSSNSTGLSVPQSDSGIIDGSKFVAIFASLIILVFYV